MPFDERDLDQLGEVIRSEASLHRGNLGELERRERTLRRRQLAGVGSLVVVLLAGAMFVVVRRPASEADLAVSGGGSTSALAPSSSPASGRSCVPPSTTTSVSSSVTSSVPNTRGGVSSTASVTQSTGPSAGRSPVTPTAPATVTSSVPAGATSQGAAPAGASAPSPDPSKRVELASSPLPPGEDPTPGPQLPLATGGGVRANGPGRTPQQGTPSSPTSGPSTTSGVPSTQAGGASTTSPSTVTTTRPSTTSTSIVPTTPVCCVTTGFVEAHIGDAEGRTNGIYTLKFLELPPPYKGKEGVRCHQLAEVLSDNDGTSIGYVTLHHPDDPLPPTPRDQDAKLIGTSLVEKSSEVTTLDVNGTQATVRAYEPTPGAPSALTVYVVTLTTPDGTAVVHGSRLDQITDFLRNPNRTSLLGV